MKTSVRAISVLFSMALLAMGESTVGALNATTTSRNTSTISTQIQHKLAGLPWYGVFDNLAYQVNGSEVILSGQVISERDRAWPKLGEIVP